MPSTISKKGGIRSANTVVMNNGTGATVTLYQTVIFHWDKVEDRVTLNTGGFKTPTTFRRMNEALAHYGFTRTVGIDDFRKSDSLSWTV